jgi:hypothetical protein
MLQFFVVISQKVFVVEKKHVAMQNLFRKKRRVLKKWTSDQNI